MFYPSFIKPMCHFNSFTSPCCLQLPYGAFDLLNETQTNATGLMTAQVCRELVIIFDIFNN